MFGWFRKPDEEIRTVKISKLKIDPRYQKQPDMRLVEKIMEDFDPAQVGYIVVTPRRRHFVVIDGVTRVEAAKMSGYKRMVVLVRRRVDPVVERIRLNLVSRRIGD